MFVVAMTNDMMLTHCNAANNNGNAFSASSASRQCEQRRAAWQNNLPMACDAANYRVIPFRCRYHYRHSRAAVTIVRRLLPVSDQRRPPTISNRCWRNRRDNIAIIIQH